MRGRIKNYTNVGDTERVFAWLPTYVDHPGDKYQLVWLTWVTRKVRYVNSEGNGYEYTP